MGAALLGAKLILWLGTTSTRIFPPLRIKDSKYNDAHEGELKSGGDWAKQAIKLLEKNDLEFSRELAESMR